MPEPWPLGAAAGYFNYEAWPHELMETCDLCGRHGPWVTVARQDRYGFHVHTVECWCGLAFQSPHLTEPGLAALYSGPYRALVSAWHGREINAQTLEPEQEAYGMRLGDTLLQNQGQRKWASPRLLDLGGSTGMVAGVAGWRINSHHVTIVEPSMAEAAVAVQRAYNSRVVVQSAEDFEPGEEKWDLILLCQTVDHLRSISAVLAKVRTWLAPGGRFFVDAVDSSLIPEPVRYKVDHIYSLTRATMRAYLERAGFVAREVPAPSTAQHVAFLCEVAE